jgi:hypothetical protein
MANEDFLGESMKLLLDITRMVHSAIHQTVEEGRRVARTLGRLIKIAVVVACAVPVAMIMIDAFLSRRTAIIIMPLFALILPIFFIILVWTVNAMKLGVSAGALLGLEAFAHWESAPKKAKDFSTIAKGLKSWAKTFRAIMVGELLLAGYLALVQPTLRLTPFFILSILLVLMGTGWKRKLGMLAAGVLTVLFLMTTPSVALPAFAANMMPHKPAGYSANPCAIPETLDLSKKNISSLTIDLQAGCLHGWITLPENAADYKAFLGKPVENPALTPTGTPEDMEGDASEWVAFQCPGHRRPGKVVHWTPTQDGEIDGALDKCYAPGAPTDSFRLEGKGTLFLVITQKK